MARASPRASMAGNIARLGQGGLAVAAEADEGVADALEGGEKAEDLFGLTAGGEGDDHVAVSQGAKVAVQGFGGMKEKRRGAGGAEGGGDLLGDDAALAHAGDDDPAAGLAALHHQLDGALEVGSHRSFEPGGEGQQRLSLDPDQLRGGVYGHAGSCL
jgi:hypothetical protein